MSRDPQSTQSAPSPRPRDEARAFWTGPRLSPYEELSLLSFVAAGARVLLYTNDMSLRVPQGVELVPVDDIVTQDTQIFAYEDGDQCLTPHSDLFRYAAIEACGGWYFDLDVVCLRNELPEAKVYLAREADDIVNAAVMKFPAQSPFLAAAREEAHRLLPEAGRLTIGPELITRLASDYALDHLIRPPAKAYEIHTTEILAMFDPHQRERLEERVADSDFVHLWNEIWRRIRIPKNFGPPAGSFLDGLFRRFDIRFSAEGRLSLDALRTWQRERYLLAQIAARLDVDTVPDNAFGLLIEQSKRQGIAPYSSRRPETPAVHEKSSAPQTVRTLWHGGSIGPCQLLCLRSFVDRGHRVEVFTFDSSLAVPSWLSLRDAGEILPQHRVSRYLANDERFAIHANLFRYALLHKLGGWWIDPDVVFVGVDLPVGDVFVAGPGEFGVASPAVMKVPAGHFLVADALKRIAMLEGTVADWGRTGAPLLTESINHTGLAPLAAPDLVSPVSWFEVLSLFDPAQADDVAQRCAGRCCLDLHHEVWLRSGVPDYLAPPPGSFLDRLFQEHRIGFQLVEQMDFGDVRRWITHMYDSMRLGAVPAGDGSV
jgi:hypothetical protein